MGGAAAHNANPTEAFNYTLRLCAPLSQPCGDSSSASACQSKGAEHFPIGYFHQRPRIFNVELVLTFTDGASCSDELDRTTTVTFVCGDDALGDSFPVFEGESQKCVYEFSWRTKHACGDGLRPTEPVECAAAYNGVTYDLSLLRRTGATNWLARNLNSSAEEYDFYINVCSPLTGKQPAGCVGAAVCQVW